MACVFACAGLTSFLFPKGNESKVTEETALEKINWKSVPKDFDTLQKNVKYGNSDTITYYSSVTKCNRNSEVILPAGYSADTKYPVLYLLHGIGGTENEWMGGNPIEVLSNAVASGTAVPMIIVMPNVRAAANNWYPSGNEMFGPKNIIAFDNFINDLRDCLMPYIESHYNVYTDRAHTAIAGLSMGGRESLFIGIKMQERFSAVGAFSPAPGLLPTPSLGYEGQLTENDFVFKEAYIPSLLVICVGTSDNVIGTSAQDYDKAFTKNTIPHQFYTMPGGHDFSVWKNGLYQFITRIFKSTSFETASGESTAMTSLKNKKAYCGTWASAQYLTEEGNMPAIPLAHYTLRQIIHTSVAGDTIRLLFSNACGEKEIEMQSVHVALSIGGSKIDKTTDTIVTFNGSESVTILPGKELFSDTISFKLPAVTNVAVSIYFTSVPEKLTGHPGSRTTSFVQLGNMVSEPRISVISSLEHWYVLSGIDVLSDDNLKSVVCFGDSITDGRGTTTDAQNRWTDILAARLQNNESTKKISVLNEGIGGTLVSGSGVQRFKKDALDQRGVSYILMLYGVNDILYANATAASIISVYKKLIAQAHKATVLIYGCTILPFGKCNDYTEKREAVRKEVNDWIRTTSAADGGFDACIDFDTVMRDPANEQNTLAAYNCGDGLHPSPAGYQKMAEAIDLSLFTK